MRPNLHQAPVSPRKAPGTRFAIVHGRAVRQDRPENRGAAVTGHLRIVKCQCCEWISIIPASLEAEPALEVARGLALLHLENSHSQNDALDESHFDFENFDDAPSRAP